MRKVLEIGGMVAAAILIAFGVVTLVLSVQGRSTVSSNLKNQQITGTPDMTPQNIAPEVKAAEATQNTLVAKFKTYGITFTPSKVTAPGCSVANDLVDSGSRARCFAQYMFIHAIGGAGGLVYSQMSRYMAKSDTPFQYTDGYGGVTTQAKVGTLTNAQIMTKYAQVDAQTGQPVSNGARNLWIDQVALSTALNASYMADQIAMFGVVVGVALLLAGFGFGILAVGGALRNPDTALGWFAHKKPTDAAPAPSA